MDLGCWDNVLVAKRYRPVTRDQAFLLPPDMADWLSDDHLVWFLIDVMAALDTSELTCRAARRRDGRARRTWSGRAAYDPVMLATVLIYAYAMGERSSRRIERLCQTDAAYRIACAGDVPDHTVIARFRQNHASAFAGLFAQVLRLCREAGLVRLGTVAIDGTKIAANASREANRSRDWFDGHRATGADPDADARADRGLALGILDEAAETDAAEDAEFGPARGDELPAGWHGRAGRAERIRAAKARLDEREAVLREQARAEQAARVAKAEARLTQARRALAAEQAAAGARMRKWEKARADAVATGTSVPKGRAPIRKPSVVRRAQDRQVKAERHPRDTLARPEPEIDLSKARANITDPDSSLMPSRQGWVQGYNGQFSISADQIILATAVSTNPADIVSYQPMVDVTLEAVNRLGAADELGVLLFDAGYASQETLTGEQPNRLIALGKSHSVPPYAPPPVTTPPPVTHPSTPPHERRWITGCAPAEGAALYARRATTVEPGIGNFKKLLSRASRRGLAAVTSEIQLAATAFNLRKLHIATPAATA